MVEGCRIMEEASEADCTEGTELRSGADDSVGISPGSLFDVIAGSPSDVLNNGGSNIGDSVERSREFVVGSMDGNSAPGPSIMVSPNKEVGLIVGLSIGVFLDCDSGSVVVTFGARTTGFLVGATVGRFVGTNGRTCGMLVAESPFLSPPPLPDIITTSSPLISV